MVKNNIKEKIIFLSLQRISTGEAMNYRKDNYWYDDELLNSVGRYEEMIKNHTRCFFDVHEFEDIIDYYLDTEDFIQASQVVDYAVSIYPSATSLQLRMAEIMIDKSQPVKALSILNQLEHLESAEYGVFLLKGAALNMLGRPKEAHRQFEKAISLADENKIEVLYNIGISFERINQHKVALKYFLKVQAMEPDNYYVSYDLAYCYERLNDLEKSVTYYHKYLDEDPFSEHVWYNLGIVYNKKDDNLKAVEAYDYALAINEDYSSAHFNRANTLALLDRHREAIVAYKEVIRIEPENASAFCYMGECYERLEDYDLAIVHYLKALAFDDKFTDAWFGLGIVKLQTGDSEEGIRDIQRAIELDNQNTEYLFSLASAYANRQQYDKAVEIFKLLVQYITSDITMWDCFAQAYAKQNIYNDAQKVIMEALHFNPDSVMLRYRLAAYYLLNHDCIQGLAVLKEALDKQPEESDCFFEMFDSEIHDEEILALVEKFKINESPDSNTNNEPTDI